MTQLKVYPDTRNEDAHPEYCVSYVLLVESMFSFVHILVVVTIW